MIRAILWAARTYLAAHLLMIVAIITLFCWLPGIGRPLRGVSSVLVRCAVKLIGLKLGKVKR